MDRFWLTSTIGGVLTIAVLRRLYASEMLRGKFSRALFKFGYLLYANTRCGRWLNDRNIRKAQVKFGDDGAHSESVSFSYGSLQIWPIPCIFDNYAYAVVDSRTNDVVIIDAGDGAAILRFLEEKSLTPKAVLTTHRHWDHCGGNELLKKRYSSVAVYGSGIDKADGVTQTVSQEQRIEIGSLEFMAYSTPGHTRGHMVYLLKTEDHGSDVDCLFTGDLLFLGGCGKMFEGTAAEMLCSMDFLSTLPDSTLIWPGHEYSISNLVWAFTVDPENVVLQDKLIWARDQRTERLPTCPSTLEEEKQYNLFLRTSDIGLVRRLGVISPVEDDSSVADDDDEKENRVVTDEQRLQAFIKIRGKKDRVQ